MDYVAVAAILNKHVLGRGKAELFRKIALNPERFVGLFRPTKPRAKILQHLLQSNEIRFGDAVEEVTRELIVSIGYTSELTTIDGSDGERLSLDQYFRKDEQFYFFEQKVRDDHDSTKKRGQIDNFERKLEALVKRHGSSIRAGMHFVDPSLMKNRKYYRTELLRLERFWRIELMLFYGPELFAYLGSTHMWDTMIQWIKSWKEALPDLPEVNFDEDPEDSCEAIWQIDRRVWRRVLQNEQLWTEGLLHVLFPKGDTLRKVASRLSSMDDAPSHSLCLLIKEIIESHYGSSMDSANG